MKRGIPKSVKRVINEEAVVCLNVVEVLGENVAKLYCRLYRM